MFLAVWLVYALHVVPGGGVNPNRYFDLTHSLVNEHTVTIDAYHENTIDKAFKDGHYYSLGVPGPSFVGTPAYLIFKAAYRILPQRLVAPISNIQSFKQGQQSGFYQRDNTEFFLSTIWITWFALSLISALAAVTLFKLLLGLGVSRSNSLLATIAYSFGTPVFFFSTTYFSHAFAASFVIFALYLLFKLTIAPRRVTFMLLGLAAATAVLMEYQALFLAGGVAIYVLLKWKVKESWSFFAAAAIPCAVLLIYNTLAFGGPFHSAYEFTIGQNAQFHNVGALGFTIPRPERLFGLTFAPRRGLFIYSPILLLSFVGFVSALRQRKQPAYGFVLLSIFAVIGCWLWISSFQAWDGSSTFGPRLLVSIVPFLVIGMALGLAKVPRVISVPLVALSVAINWLGAQYGFAANIWEPWRRFFATGFTLPVLSALTSHSRSESALTLLVTNRMWLIALIYAALIAGCFLLVFGSSLRRRTNPIAKSSLAESRV